MVPILGKAHWEHFVNVAAILENLYPGIAIGPDMDCNVEQIDGVVRIVGWKRQEKQPSIDDLRAAEPAALAALQAEQTKREESTTARDDAKRALTALDTIIAGIDGATLVQAKTAIKQLAQVQRHIILALLGRP